MKQPPTPVSGSARRIIERLGGYAATAEITGVKLNTVYRWTYETERGGTGGYIPREHHDKIAAHFAGKQEEFSRGDLVDPAPYAEAA